MANKTTTSLKKTTNKKTAKKQLPATMPTLLQAIERVVELSRDSKLSDDFFLQASVEIGFLCDSFGISEVQAVLFCVCMERGPRRVDYDDLAHYLDLSKVCILRYASDIDALVRRRLLRYHDVKEEDDFDVPAVVIRSLKHNEVYEQPKHTGLDCSELFDVLREWFDDLSNSAITPDDLNGEIEALFKENKQVGFARQMLDMSVSRESRLLLTLFSHLLVNEDDNDVRFGQMENVFANHARFNRVRGLLRCGEHELMQANLIENCCEEGIADTTRYKLTESAKRSLLAEMKINATEERLSDVVRAKDLKAKEMFYTDENQLQVSELQSFLMPDSYNEIRKRMQQTGFRTSFACLFYGGPGTGKTETAYQLARQTGRDIMIVDVPQIKSKWVGDSEKNIKALFDRYRELVKKSDESEEKNNEEYKSPANPDGNPYSSQAKRPFEPSESSVIPHSSLSKPFPILLFNEADAIIGIRKQGAQNAVDKMENSIQNIILQEMEQLDGIMIATTNLTQNFDTAFERRFLYKIKFEKPDADVRKRLWLSMIPTLSATDATTLAERFDLSGGQIENVARKHAINNILHGASENPLKMLSNYCKEEQIRMEHGRKVGFA